MSKPTYPTGIDLQNFITGMGLIASPLTPTQAMFDFDNAIQAAVDSFETKTDYKPFLAALDTRFYDPPGAYPMRGTLQAMRGGQRALELDNGLLASPAPIVTAYLVQHTLSGSVLTPLVNYWLRPTNAPNKGRPYSWIEFLYPIMGSPDSISITGYFGYNTSISDAMWRALLKKGFANLGPEIAANLSEGLVEFEASVKTLYGKDPLGTIIDRCEKDFERSINRYRRYSFGP